ncbi:unnamed protein product [Colias eurytheme]|nr:unnamed protein product [Colias eurytheme]
MCFYKRCSCMEVETGCLIWAIFTSIIKGIAILLGVGFLIYMNIEFIQQSGDKDLGNVLSQVFNIVGIFILSLIISSFIFSIYLLLGVIKKRPQYIKAYIIYSAMIFSMLVVICVILTATSRDILLPSVFGISISVFHGLILNMVFKTYEKFNGDSFQQYTYSQVHNVNNGSEKKLYF